MTVSILPEPAPYVKLKHMPEFQDYKPISEVVKDPGVPYTHHWVWILLKGGHIEGQKRAGRWWVYMPSLLEYIKKMDELGTKKFI